MLIRELINELDDCQTASKIEVKIIKKDGSVVLIPIDSVGKTAYCDNTAYINIIERKG